VAKRLLENYFSELSLGQFELTPRRTVTETDVVQWSMFTGDWFPMHSDAIFAAESMFGQRIAAGLMILAMSGGLVVPATTRSIIANYGNERVRYPSPTFIGDTIQVRVTITKLEPRDGDSGIMDMEWDVMNQNGTVVCNAIFKVLLAMKEPQE
jgi:3-hydroxybutyryl-CoA dehydratase